MIRLSFIVPFYGVEMYIEECIRSLYDQNIPMDEYEVICVDDCSPDGSRAIVERLQKKYPTLRLLIHAENKRQGGARNTAIREAKGKYVWFVDSDDYIKPNCLKRLLELAERENLDILDFDFDSDFTKQPYRKNVESFEMGVCTGTNYVFDTRHGGRWSWRCSSVWGGLIKRELISDMRFREKVQYEDNDYALEMYARAKRVHHIPDQPYYYRVVGDSTVNRDVTMRDVAYNIELLMAYSTMHDRVRGIDARWGNGVEELIRYVSVQVVRQLGKVPATERRQFYQKRMGDIEAIRPYLGKKVWLSLNMNIARRIFRI